MKTKTKRRAKRLPNKPSELIRVAIRDFREVLRLKKYRINMGTWHQPTPRGKTCQVCLAGAVIARSLAVSPKKEHCPMDRQGATSRKLQALNAFRVGSFGAAFHDLGIATPDGSTQSRALYDLRRLLPRSPELDCEGMRRRTSEDNQRLQDYLTTVAHILEANGL